MIATAFVVFRDSKLMDNIWREKPAPKWTISTKLLLKIGIVALLITNYKIVYFQKKIKDIQKEFGATFILLRTFYISNKYIMFLNC
jgi:hypothetical protein